MRVYPGPGRLYAAIERAGFKVDGFASRMGINRVSLWRMDRGLITPSREWLERAAALLGVAVEDIAPEEELSAASA